MQDESTDLLGEANIDYTDMNLKAGFINVAWRSNLLKALPSSDKDSTITPLLTLSVPLSSMEDLT